jgi:thioredoxin
MGDRPAQALPPRFAELVRVSSTPVLVDFWAEWCGPCRTVSPSVERIAREWAGRLLTVKVNVDRRPAIAQRYDVQGIPTLVLFWKGAELMRLTGAYPYEEITRAIEESWPRGAQSPPTDSTSTSARRGDPRP